MKQKGFAPILIVLVITILGIVGYFAYKNISDNRTQTYMNKGLPFTFQYSKNNVVQELSDQQSTHLTVFDSKLENNLIDFSYFANSTQTLDQWITSRIKILKGNQKGLISGDIKPIVLNNIQGKSITFSGTDNYEVIFIKLPQKGFLEIINFLRGGTDQVLNSFSLTH